MVGTKVASSTFGRVISRKVAPKEALWRVAATKVAPSRPLGALWMASGALLKRSWELPEAGALVATFWMSEDASGAEKSTVLISLLKRKRLF